MHILCDVCMCNVVCVEGLFNMQFLTFIGKSLVGEMVEQITVAPTLDENCCNHCQTLDTKTQFIETAVNEKLAIKSATIILSDVKSATII